MTDKLPARTLPDRNKPRRKHGFWRDAAGYVVMIVICTLLILPFLLMVLNSFKSREELFSYPPTFFPERWTLGNYKSMFIYPGIDRHQLKELQEQGHDMTDIVPTEEQQTQMLIDSSIARVYFNVVRIVVLTALGSVIFGGLAAYAFAKIEFPGREILFLILLSTMMIPWMTILLPRYLMFRRLGWVGTPMPLFIPELLFGLLNGGFAVFFYRQHFRSIPKDLVDSGLIDGASHWVIFWRLVMPMSKAIVITIIMFSILFKWNGIVEPLVYLTKPKQYTPALMLYQLIKVVGNENDPTSTGLQMTSGVITTVPVLITFFLAQRYFVAGMTQGALKE